jgi:hypothetical protein
MTLSTIEREAVWIGRSADYALMRGHGDYKQDRKSVIVVLTDEATNEQLLSAIDHVANVLHGKPKPTSPEVQT